jgi:probable F420-dependent oxidoreductase
VAWPHPLERLRGTVGIWTATLDALAPDRCGEVAREVEQLGYPALWLPEAWGREALTHAGLHLSATTELVVATGIANIWARDAVATANASRTLSAVSGGRFVLGLGVSHQPLVERLRGHDYETPLAHMASYLAALDSVPMFAAEAHQPYPTVVAALGPRMLRLGATAAQGVFTYKVTTEHTAGAREIVGDAFLCVEQAAVLGGDREEFLRRAHQHLEFYTGLENYRASWRRLGFSDDDFVRGGSERLCDALVVHGGEETILDRVDEHRRAGADHVCLQLLGAELTTPPIDEWRRLSAAVNS